MELNERVDKLEDEVKIVKNEVQAVLLDIRENYLNRENPFNPDVSSPTLHTVAAAVGGQNAAAAPPNYPPTYPPPAPLTEILQPLQGKVVDGREEVEQTEPEPAMQSMPTGTTETQEENKEVETAVEEPANEEVNEVMRSDVEEPEVTPMEQAVVQKKDKVNNGKIDLVTIAGLTRWVSNAVGTFGLSGTETVLDFAELSGHLPADIKNTLVRYANRLPQNHNGHTSIEDSGNGNGNGNGNGHNHNHSVSAHKFISAIIELEGLLGMDNRLDELTLLSMICQEVDP
jgi:hypothetical protein